MTDSCFESVTMTDFEIQNPKTMMDSNLESVIVEGFRISNPVTMTDFEFRIRQQ